MYIQLYTNSTVFHPESYLMDIKTIFNEFVHMQRSKQKQAKILWKDIMSISQVSQ